MKTPRTLSKNSQRLHIDPLTRVLLELCAEHNNRPPAHFIKEMTEKYAKEHNISVSGHYNSQAQQAAAASTVPLHMMTLEERQIKMLGPDLAAKFKEKREKGE